MQCETSGGHNSWKCVCLSVRNVQHHAMLRLSFRAVNWSLLVARMHTQL